MNTVEEVKLSDVQDWSVAAVPNACNGVVWYGFFSTDADLCPRFTVVKSIYRVQIQIISMVNLESQNTENLKRKG